MRFLVSVSLIAVMSGSTAFACTQPSAPTSFPDGKSAAMDQMMDAKKVVDQYRKDIEAFISCEKDSPKAESAHAELERVASRFNNEVRAYKAANAGK